MFLFGVDQSKWAKV